MATRETSRKAYEELVESGQLKGHQATILKAVIGGPNRTSGEICAALGLDNVNKWRARFSELAARGLIIENGQRVCDVTGRTALVWIFTDRTKALEARPRTGTKELRVLLKRARLLLDVANLRGAAANVHKRLVRDLKAAGI